MNLSKRYLESRESYVRIKYHLTSTSTYDFLSTTLSRFLSRVNDRYFDFIEVPTNTKSHVLFLPLLRLREGSTRLREAEEIQLRLTMFLQLLELDKQLIQS